MAPTARRGSPRTCARTVGGSARTPSQRSWPSWGWLPVDAGADRQTTRQGRGGWRAPDLIGRHFAADRLNRKWYGDGTEIPTDEGKLHLDSVLDMGSRRIVGFAVGEHHNTDLALAALQMAVAVRGGKTAVHRWQLPGCLHPARHHPVHGPRWVGAGQCGYRVLALHLEFELRDLEHFATKARARARVANWIEEYNTQRRHSALGMRSPIDYELAQMADQERAA